MTSRAALPAAALAAVALLAACAPPSDTPRHGRHGGSGPPRVARPLDWHGRGVWLRGDTHIHRLLSGHGRALAREARKTGLDFIAMTDHAHNVFRRNPASKLADLRERFPDLIVLAGIEWNIPAGDHATVVVEQLPGELELLETFTRSFDRKGNREMRVEEPDDDEEGSFTWGGLDRAIEALSWLGAAQREGGPRTAVYLNHLTRHGYLSAEQIAELQAAGLSGVEAAPGHQKRQPPGNPRTIDRHSQFVIEVGGGYDRVLAQGRHLGLSAGSDFHVPDSAYHPGVFSRTLVYAPERSSSGVVQGLAAGSTVTVLGGIVDLVETATSCSGFDDAAGIGEVLEVPVGAQVTYRVTLEVPARDFEGRPNRIDAVEVISNCAGPIAVVRTFDRIQAGRAEREFRLPPAATASPRACFLRARGRRKVGGSGNDLANADLLFHTAATRLVVAAVAAEGG